MDAKCLVASGPAGNLIISQRPREHKEKKVSMMNAPRCPAQCVRSVASALFIVMILVPELGNADQTLRIRSGNGVPGSTDSLVRVLKTRGRSEPTEAVFDAVKTNALAFIPVNLPRTYVTHLSVDADAKWVCLAHGLPDVSALYAIPFVVADPVIASGSILLTYAIDNELNGLYLNGHRVSGDSVDGDYRREFQLYRDDIAPLLIPNATNWLYLNLRDWGGAAGVMFSADIQIVGGTMGIVPQSGGNVGFVTAQLYGLHGVAEPPVSVGDGVLRFRPRWSARQQQASLSRLTSAGRAGGSGTR